MKEPLGGTVFFWFIFVPLEAAVSVYSIMPTVPSSVGKDAQLSPGENRFDFYFFVVFLFCHNALLSFGRFITF